MNLERKHVAFNKLRISPFTFFDKDWLLLAAGDFPTRRFNAMTIAWGSIGTMWQRPLVMVVVRPNRHTFKFMENYPTFTLSAFPEKYRSSLEYMGAHSGKNEDKIANARLTPEASRSVAAPSFAEASLVLECRKNYADDFDPARFMAPYIAELYNNDYHRVYFGEVMDVTASDTYLE